jgi:hypothetical protein
MATDAELVRVRRLVGVALDALDAEKEPNYEGRS